MRRVSALAVALTFIFFAAGPARALDLSARAALVEDASGHILYERNADMELPMASTTKVMTALTVIEKGGLDGVVTISRHAASIPPSNLELQAGEKFRVWELLYGMLLHSANDAAVALAEHYDGSEAAFAADMTRRAHELGAIHTHFSNPNGLPIADHYTTARDLALIMHAALENPTFRRIASTQDVTLYWPGYHAPRRLHNINRFLTQYFVPVLGKTGFTDAAMHCYVGTTESARPVTVVLLGSWNLWGDARTLLNYGLSAEAHRPLTVGYVSEIHRTHSRYIHYPRYRSYRTHVAHTYRHRRGYYAYRRHYRYRAAYLPR